MHVRMYADDVVVSNANLSDLQRALDATAAWARFNIGPKRRAGLQHPRP